MKKKHKKASGKKKLACSLTGVFILLCLFVYFSLNSPNQTVVEENPQLPVFEQSLRAAIVDHLSVSQPNDVFWQTSKAMLEEAGFQVDYIPGEDVTVGFYMTLPFRRYDLIVFRVHSTATPSTAEIKSEDVIFFTSEQYSATEHVDEQLSGGLVKVYMHEGAPAYFGINPLFVTNEMKGTFKNATIIMMGCEGLKYTSMAEAFIQKGAEAYISWDDGVTVQHTDLATTHLLQNLVTEEMTIQQAVTETMNKVGSDPKYHGTLYFYPSEAAD